MVSWRKLNKCETAEQIADLLKNNGIKGTPFSSGYCPLAVATGWRVGATKRWRKIVLKRCRRVRMTDAQVEFVKNFDMGEYPWLENEN